MKGLRNLRTADDLKNLADERLQDLAERLGRIFEEIKPSELGKAFGELQERLQQIETFKEEWYRKIKEAANQSFSANLNFVFVRASSNERLLDVEINLKESQGIRLAQQAAGGDFAEVLSNYNPQLIRVHRGAFTHKLSRSAQLQINVLGWNHNSLVKLIQNSEHAIETVSGGLLHVYAHEVAIQQRKEVWRPVQRTGGESVLAADRGRNLSAARSASEGNAAIICCRAIKILKPSSTRRKWRS